VPYLWLGFNVNVEMQVKLVSKGDDQDVYRAENCGSTKDSVTYIDGAVQVRIVIMMTMVMTMMLMMIIGISMMLMTKDNHDKNIEKSYLFELFMDVGAREATREAHAFLRALHNPFGSSGE